MGSFPDCQTPPEAAAHSEFNHSCIAGKEKKHLEVYWQSDNARTNHGICLCDTQLNRYEKVHQQILARLDISSYNKERDLNTLSNISKEERFSGRAQHAKPRLQHLLHFDDTKGRSQSPRVTRIIRGKSHSVHLKSLYRSGQMLRGTS